MISTLNEHKKSYFLPKKFNFFYSSSGNLGLSNQYIPPPADTSWTSTDSGIVCADPLLPTTLNDHEIQHAKQNLNNNNDDIMKEFTDFVDLVDTLQGMPEIDFEDNFEMFP